MSFGLIELIGFSILFTFLSYLIGKVLSLARPAKAGLEAQGTQRKFDFGGNLLKVPLQGGPDSMHRVYWGALQGENKRANSHPEERPRPLLKDPMPRCASFAKIGF